MTAAAAPFTAPDPKSMSGMDNKGISGTTEMGGNQRINIGEPQLRMQPVQGDQMQGLTPDQGISSQGMGTGDMSSTPAAGRDVGLGREPISGQHGNIRDENLPTEPIGNQRTTVETVGGPNVYVPVIPITNADLEGAKRTETKSTEYGEHHDEGKKPMGQKIKEMLPGTQEHKLKKAEERGNL